MYISSSALAKWLQGLYLPCSQRSSASNKTGMNRTRYSEEQKKKSVYPVLLIRKTFCHQKVGPIVNKCIYTKWLEGVCICLVQNDLLQRIQLEWIEQAIVKGKKKCAINNMTYRNQMYISRSDLAKWLRDLCLSCWEGSSASNWKQYSKL
jgi:hypothetical protein